MPVAFHSVLCDSAIKFTSFHVKGDQCAYVDVDLKRSFIRGLGKKTTVNSKIVCRRLNG